MSETCAVTGCALGPAHWLISLRAHKKFGRAWVSIEGAKGIAVAAAATSAKVSVKSSNTAISDIRSGAATARESYKGDAAGTPLYVPRRQSANCRSGALAHFPSRDSDR